MKKRIALLYTALLLVLSVGAKSKAPKYVFYFIGDGMGVNQVMATQYYLSDIEGTLGYKPLCFTQFPYSGFVITRAVVAASNTPVSVMVLTPNPLIFTRNITTT